MKTGRSCLSVALLPLCLPSPWTPFSGFCQEGGAWATVPPLAPPTLTLPIQCGSEHSSQGVSFYPRTGLVFIRKKGENTHL